MILFIQQTGKDRCVLATIKPFKAMRFTKKAGGIKELVCPPYDIISEEQRLAYLKRNEHNIIRLELPREQSLRESGDSYAAAGETLAAWLDDGILAKDEAESLYIYEEEFTVSGVVHTVKGFTCRVRLEEFSAGIVLPHEETLSKAKADRFDLMCATNSNFSSIYSLYFDGDNAVYSIIDSISMRDADIEFKTDDGVTHRLWLVTDEKAIEKICMLMREKKLYIADGHHRYETALNYKKHLVEKGESMDESHAANYIMMTLVNMEHEGLVVFPTHRIVRGVKGFSAEKLLEECGKYFDIETCGKDNIEAKIAECEKDGRKAFGVYGDKLASLLILKDAEIMKELLPQKSEAYQNLDVSILHTLILERLLGIDKENMANQKNLIYTRDIGEAIGVVDSGDANCAFIIGATKVAEIAAVASSGEKMPQKSTYFYPKLITGLVMNKLD